MTESIVNPERSESRLTFWAAVDLNMVEIVIIYDSGATTDMPVAIAFEDEELVVSADEVSDSLQALHEDVEGGLEWNVNYEKEQQVEELERKYEAIGEELPTEKREEIEKRPWSGPRPAVRIMKLKRMDKVASR